MEEKKYLFFSSVMGGTMHYEELSKGKVRATFEFFYIENLDFYILPDDFDSLMVKTKNKTYL